MLLSKEKQTILWFGVFLYGILSCRPYCHKWYVFPYRQITTSYGDIMLYQGNNIVIFYGSNSWSYTPLGKIDNATTENLRQFLGNGNVTLTITLAENSGIDNVFVDAPQKDAGYDLKGNHIAHRPLAAGLYIINGKKTLIRP